METPQRSAPDEPSFGACRHCGQDPKVEVWPFSKGLRKTSVTCENTDCDVRPAILGNSADEAADIWNQLAGAAREVC